MTEKALFEKSVAAVRILLAIQYLLSGLNWYFKILPFPSMSDGTDFVQKHEIAAAMIATGWMFDATKIIELLAGISLLLNRFVPLMLVVSFTVASAAFLLDAFILDELYGVFTGTVSIGVAWAAIKDMVFFGGIVMIMQIYLMLAYLDCYKPMLAMKPIPKMP